VKSAEVYSSPDIGVRPAARRSRIWSRRWTTVVVDGTTSRLSFAGQSSPSATTDAQRSMALRTRS
jgi:hypothetical protein